MIAAVIYGIDLVIGFFADLWGMSESELCNCPYECEVCPKEYPEP